MHYSNQVVFLIFYYKFKWQCSYKTNVYISFISIIHQHLNYLLLYNKKILEVCFYIC
jgi:hypothetical protein